MEIEVRRVSYFRVPVRDRPGEAYRVLTELRRLGADLVAFHGYPTGPGSAQLVLFPDDPDRLARGAETLGLALCDRQDAFLVRSDDGTGGLAEALRRCADAGVNLYAAQAVAVPGGGLGALLYVRPEDLDRAARALGAG